MVSGTARSGPSEITPWDGNQKNRSCTPFSTRIPAARICPAIFAGGDRDRTSSTRPITVITPAAMRVAWSSSDSRNRERNSGIR